MASRDPSLGEAAKASCPRKHSHRSECSARVGSHMSKDQTATRRRYGGSCEYAVGDDPYV